MGFSDFVGHEDARLALMLNAIEPRCGGVLCAGEKGTGKTTLARQFRGLLPEETAFVTLPLNVTEDALLGTVDLEAAVQAGRRTLQSGLLSRAHGGVLFIDDVNLLSNEALSLVLETTGRKENVVEREGISERHASDYILIATMDPEEGILSPHLLDRFGMCVFWESVQETDKRRVLLKRVMENRFCIGGVDSPGDAALRERIKSCRILLKDVEVPDEVMNHISLTCLENVVSGHRADVFLYYAAKAYAAYSGDKRVATGHVDAVAPLVLLHRKRNVVPPEENMAPEHHQGDKENDEKPEENDRKENQAESNAGNGEKDREQSPPPDDNQGLDPDSVMTESALKEEVFETGRTFRTRRFVFRKDKLKRITSGRRTKTRSKDKGGRYVRSVLKAEQDVAIDATIRAAAPYQKLRNRRDMLVIRESDLRYKQREKKTGHLVVFAVDGSGSMGARRRMTEAKGAVQSLLVDCYQKRDKVALLVFRKDKAEVVLQPTSSIQHASRRLKEIPTGGKTPLSAGLLETLALMKRTSKKSPETRFLVVFVTDGRANHALSGLPVGEEISRLAQYLREFPSTDYVVVDTEDKGKFMTADRAVTLAAHLNAAYFTMEELEADRLVEIVESEKQHTGMP